ncbi:MAG TPA: ABC transporter substrate-binding protein [Burkholderiales bacterium]|nr:ABC transporter substrate-binding protein [Burkholderiales bacterium]
MRERHHQRVAVVTEGEIARDEARGFVVRLGETNFSSVINSIYKSKPSFLFGAMAGKDHELFLQQAHQRALFNSVPYPGGLISVTELKHHRKTLPRGLIGLARCPFFAHLGEPLMQQYIRRDRRALGPDAYPDDWACMHYDALHALDQAARKAGSVETAALVKALKGATVDTCRGKLKFRDCSNQLDAPSYVGEVWDSRDYPFPIYKPETLVVVPGNEVWTPTCAEVDKLKEEARLNPAVPGFQEAIYARSACVSCAVSSSLTLTRSPIDTSPSSLPSSTTGKWRKRRSVMSPSASSTDIDSRPATMLHVMRASTARVSKSRSPLACRRTTSRSVKMPTGHPSASGTSTAPIFSACMVRMASAILDLADTVTKRRPLAASTSLSFMARLLRCSVTACYRCRFSNVSD